MAERLDAEPAEKVVHDRVAHQDDLVQFTSSVRLGLEQPLDQLLKLPADQGR